MSLSTLLRRIDRYENMKAHHEQKIRYNTERANYYSNELVEALHYRSQY